jgi:hypothetical protein
LPNINQGPSLEMSCLYFWIIAHEIGLRLEAFWGRSDGELASISTDQK